MTYLITADINVRCKLAVGAHNPTDAKRRAAANLRRLEISGDTLTTDTALLDEKKARVCILKIEDCDLYKEMRQLPSVRTDPDAIEFFND